MSFWHKLVEERISQASERGEFDGLPGRGKPMELSDDSHIPDDLRLAYKVLGNAGFTPPELELRSEIKQVEDLLANAPDERTRYKAMKRINFLAMKLGTIRPGIAALEDSAYAGRVAERLSKSKK